MYCAAALTRLRVTYWTNLFLRDRHLDRNHDKNNLVTAAREVLDTVLRLGYDALLNRQIKDWKDIWEMSDITIDGDVEAQQGIRFNIFQLNQTYLGRDTSLNIGPKGFTGEKYIKIGA